MIRILAVALCLASAAALAAGAREAPLLALPVACDPGRDCFIQHHVDIDPSAGVRDFACGTASYEGHDAVDIRVLSAAAARRGVSVIAAADGRVLRLRDGMADAFSREIGRRAVSERECGNAVVVAHAGGLETQYCHLLQGSVQVRQGQAVARGHVLGQIGYSGAADFAHVHFTVRMNGRIVDPFSGRPGGRDAAPGGDCRSAGAGDGNSLWEPGTAARLPYRASEIIQAGFTSAIPKWEDLERDHEHVASVAATSPQLLLYARTINLGAGDTLRFRIDGPGDLVVLQASEPPGRQKAIAVTAAGRRLDAARWPAGRYQGTIEIRRDGRTIAMAAADLDLP